MCHDQRTNNGGDQILTLKLFIYMFPENKLVMKMMMMMIIIMVIMGMY